MVSDTDEELKLGLILRNMRANGRWATLVEKVRSITLMAIYMRGFGIIINVMDTVFTLTKKEQGTKATGKMTLNQVREQKFGQRAANTSVNTSTVKNKEMVNIAGQMDQYIRVIGSIIGSMVSGSINGKTDVNIMVTGTTTTCMAWASTFTPTV